MVRPESRIVSAISFGRLLAHGAFDQRDHPVEEAPARLGGDPHHDPVGEHLGAAGDRRAIAARLADDRGRFAGDGRLVHRRHALDHLAVGRDQVAGLDEDEIAGPELGRAHQGEVLAAVRPRQALGPGGEPGGAERVRLRLAPALRHRLGEVGEEHREPEPERELQREADVARARGQVPDQHHGRDGGAQQHHEHHRVPQHVARIQLDRRVPDRPPHDRAVEEGMLDGSHVRRASRSASAGARRSVRARAPGRRSARRRSGSPRAAGSRTAAW